MGAWYHAPVGMPAPHTARPRWRSRCPGALPLTLLLACSAAPTAPLAPASSQRATPARPAPQPVRWAHWAQLSHWQRLPAEPFPSAGHPGAGLAQAHLPPEWAQAYRQLSVGRPLPPGALVALSLRATADGPPERWLAMERGGAGWRYLQLDREGFITSRDDERCRRCHAEAPTDGLFGLPTP